MIDLIVEEVIVVGFRVFIRVRVLVSIAIVDCI